jgi:hypothetical protein
LGVAEAWRWDRLSMPEKEKAEFDCSTTPTVGVEKTGP